MSLLTISLKIPFETDSSKDLGTSMVFTHWLPVGIDQGIAVTDGDLRIVIWFDEKSVYSLFQPNVEDLRNYFNIHVSHVNVRVQIEGLSEPLLAYMQMMPDLETASEATKSIEVEYERLVKRVLSSVIKRVNRLIAIARTMKGQHWLEERTLDLCQLQQCCQLFECCGRVDDKSMFRFCPSSTDRVFITTGSNDRYIGECDWLEIRNFVIRDGKTNLVLELLAGAERLADLEHYRGSLTEAVTALEIAVSNFARAPKSNAAFGTHMAARLSTPSLSAQVKHMGTSGTINYLLPTIIPEEILPTPILVACQEAIRQRQAVVHQGQREVDESFAKQSLAAVRKFCSILERLTQDDSQ